MNLTMMMVLMTLAMTRMITMIMTMEQRKKSVRYGGWQKQWNASFLPLRRQHLLPPFWSSLLMVMMMIIWNKPIWPLLICVCVICAARENPLKPRAKIASVTHNGTRSLILVTSSRSSLRIYTILVTKLFAFSLISSTTPAILRQSLQLKQLHRIHATW